jgi:transposase-like protein
MRSSVIYAFHVDTITLYNHVDNNIHVDMQAATNARELKGLEMARGIGRDGQPDVTIQRLNKLTYKVRSQSDPEKWYTVVKQYAKTFGENIRDGQWTCDCPDHTFRKVVCKHIHSVLFSKLLRKKVYQDTLLQTPVNQNIINEANQLGKIVCQRCASPKYQKFGIRKNKKNEELQRYRCVDCSFVYIVNPAFENAKVSAKIISISIDLFMKGTSMRKIADHIKLTAQTFTIPVFVALLGDSRKLSSHM